MSVEIETIKKLNCPKCNSGNVYQQDGENACIMCGQRWPIVKAPALIKEVPPADPAEERNKNSSSPPVKASKKKKCRNCEREKVIQSDGLCGGCFSAVYKKYTKGTPEYAAALAAARERFLHPNYMGRKRSIKQTTTKLVATGPEVSHQPTPPSFQISACGPGEQPEDPLINVLLHELAALMARAKKIDLAIAALRGV